MGGATNNGTANHAVGAVEITAARTAANHIIGNSSTTTPGIFTLNGATVNGVANTILRNASTKNFTIQNAAPGGTQSMGVFITNPGSAIAVDGTGKITISSAVSGPGGLTVTGGSSGVLTLSGTNTFTGDVSLLSAETEFPADASFGGALNVYINGGRMTCNGNYTFNAARKIFVGSAAGTGISVKTSTNVVTYNGVIADITGETGSWAKQGGNVFILGGVSTYTGSTAVNNGTIRISGNNRLPVATTLLMGQPGSTNIGTFDLFGNSQEVAGINSVAGAGAAGDAGNNIITSISPAILSIGGSGNYSYGDGTGTNSGVITGAVSIVKKGTGRQTFGDVNTYTGTTTVTGGELRFNPSTSYTLTGNAVLNGGSLSTQNITTGRNIGFGALVLTENSAISLDDDAVSTFSFAGSSAASWTAGKKLLITGWQGVSTGTAGVIRIGTGTDGLTSAQLAQIVFVIGAFEVPAIQLANGEIIPFCDTPVITSLGSNSPLCAGGTLNLGTTATGTDSLRYSWTGPAGFTSTAKNPSFAAATSASGSYMLTVTNGCGSTKDSSLTVLVNDTLVPSITISASTGTTICSGTSVEFTATPVNTGTMPVYQWKINGQNVGTNSTTYTVDTLKNSDNVVCVMSSNAVCQTSATSTSNTLQISVTNSVQPQVSIAVNPGTTVCAGTSVTFTATPVSGGTNPVYQWKLNGMVSGDNSNSFTVNTPQNGDSVTCRLTSNAGCASTPLAFSNQLILTVNNLLTPTIAISADPAGAICTGTSVTFTADVTNEGTTPVYQWKRNGVNVSGTDATYTTSILANGDSVRCVLTSSATCATPAEVSSAKITMTVNSVPATPAAFTAVASQVTSGESGVVYTVPNVAGVSYAWNYKGNGATVNGTGNSVTIDFSTNVTEDSLQVRASNSCGTSAARGVKLLVLDASEGNMKITEYQYNGSEFIEFTNVGNTYVDMSGWSFDDASRQPGSQDLGAFGVVAPGASVILAEAGESAFRATWNNLCTGIKVIGGNANNLGNGDEINIYNSNNKLVDRITYTNSGVVANTRSAWPSATALGRNTITAWTLASENDAEGSVKAVGNFIGSPGKSTRANVFVDPCVSIPSGTPTVLVDVVSTSNGIDGGSAVSPASPFGVSSVLNDATDPIKNNGITFTTGDDVTTPESLVVSVVSNNQVVVPAANLSITGTGASRHLSITPAAVGRAKITVSVSDGTFTGYYVLNYAVSANSSTPANTVWHTGIADASAALPLKGGYFMAGDDELNVINVYSRTASGLPVRSFEYTSFLALPEPSKPEVDLEAAAFSPLNTGRIYWLGSMSNGKEPFESKPNRNRIFATDVNGTADTTSFSFAGYYGNLRNALITWGDNNGYNFTASAAEGVDSKLPSGFAAEGLVFGPDSTTLYIGLRAPLVPTANRTKAVIAPIANFENWFNNGQPVGNPTFLAPIELNLGGRGFRDLTRLSNGTYIIVAGNPAGSPLTNAIYKWTGNAADAPILLNNVSSQLNAEGVMQVNNGAELSLSELQIISDGGDEVLYADGSVAKDQGELAHRKFRSDRLEDLDLCMTSYASQSDSACATYTWNGTDYTESGSYQYTSQTATGCDLVTTLQLIIKPLPVVIAKTTYNEVCAGQRVLLFGYGAAAYQWNHGVSDRRLFTPDSTRTYTVTGTDTNGCVNTASVAVVVNQLPEVSLEFSGDTVLCEGSPVVTLDGGLPQGGTYSGEGVNNGQFVPQSILGTKVISYVYTDQKGCSDTATASITVELCAGIDENGLENTISVYPNPASTIVSVNVTVSGAHELVLRNVQGAVVLKQQFETSTATINLDGIAKGMYVLSVKTNDKTRVQKLVVE